jgi:hypothetical protein
VSQYIKVECLNTERERRGERKKREGKCPSTDEQVYICCNNTMNITEQKKKKKNYGTSCQREDPENIVLSERSKWQKAQSEWCRS